MVKILKQSHPNNQIHVTAKAPPLFTSSYLGVKPYQNMKFYRLILIMFLTASVISCHETRTNYIAENTTHDLIHSLSEALYKGDGSWGAGYPYRMALRDSYWRADIYGELADKSDNGTYAIRSSEVYSYLISVQNEGGTGVFGFPADVENPEFGEVVRRVIAECPECISRGWVVSLPGDDIAELYYDHGYALTSLAKGYLRTNNPIYLKAILRAADWALDKPIIQNINYLSALGKGFAYAYWATGDIRYLNRAIYLHEHGIFPGMSLETGGALDSHNQQLEYHGFIVSGIVALKSALPANHEYHSNVDQFMTSSISHMQQRNLFESGYYGVTWPGINLLAWYELEQLRELTSGELKARNRCIELINSYKETIASENDFRLQKSLYSNFFIGLYDE